MGTHTTALIIQQSCKGLFLTGMVQEGVPIAVEVVVDAPVVAVVCQL